MINYSDCLTKHLSCSVMNLFLPQQYLELCLAYLNTYISCRRSLNMVCFLDCGDQTQTNKATWFDGLTFLCSWHNSINLHMNYGELQLQRACKSWRRMADLSIAHSRDAFCHVHVSYNVIASHYSNLTETNCIGTSFTHSLSQLQTERQR